MVYLDTLKFVSWPFFLAYNKEENLMKNVILDICFREEILRQTGVETSIFTLEQSNPVVKKVKEMIINQSPKYPKTGPLLDQGEKQKYEKLLREFRGLSADIRYTN